MEQASYLSSTAGRRYIIMSENLRSRLEVKLMELYKEGKFDVYINTRYIKPTLTAQEIVSVVIGKPFNNEAFARCICRAVKAWFGMYYDDRRSVLEKFRYYCMLCSQYKGISGEVNFPFVFTQVLVTEFTTELSDIKWSLLVNRHYQGFSEKGY
jgi:hypothetical protein